MYIFNNKVPKQFFNYTCQSTYQCSSNLECNNNYQCTCSDSLWWESSNKECGKKKCPYIIN